MVGAGACRRAGGQARAGVGLSLLVYSDPWRSRELLCTVCGAGLSRTACGDTCFERLLRGISWKSHKKKHQDAPS